MNDSHVNCPRLLLRELPFIALLFSVAVLPSAAACADERRIDYLSQVRPLLEARCYACHGTLKQAASLRLDTGALIIRGGESGAAATAGDAAGSLLIQRITATDASRMPPAGEGSAMKPEEIALLKSWIAQGAQAPVEEIPLAPHQHWAFLPVEISANSSAGPSGASTHRNLVDDYFDGQHESRQLKVQLPAERSLQIRRLYLDLIGLPPTLEQLQDDRPWEQIVDELLQSPHHGERWARHWMDVWRYSDWYGLGEQLRNSQKHIWHWRDWIVESLNADKGYDRMIQEMLAGDELAPDDLTVLRATGFLARNYYLFNRTTWLDNTIEHTSKAFLGLTLNCAKCHDHKYDPITQVDYYRFRAIFEPHQVRLDPVPGVTNLEQNGLPRVYDDQLTAETFLHRKGDAADPDRTNPLTPEAPAVFTGFASSIAAVSLPPTAYAPILREHVQQDLISKATASVTAAQRDADTARKALADARLNSASALTPDDDNQTADVPMGEISATSFAISDDFTQARPELWKLIGAGWKYEQGTLLQTTPTREQEFLQLLRPLPEDFEAACRYTTTGGTTYKSVTFRFDESEDRTFANFVYTSAYESGPKVQVAFTRNGTTSYPKDGQVGTPIVVGQAYDLRFAVRGRLINVWLNDKRMLAYLLPERNLKGRLSLSGFDATVAFDSISIRSLPKDTQLAAATNSGAAMPTDPAAVLRQAEQKLVAVQAAERSLRATIAADAAAVNAPGSPSTKEQIQTAARLQAETARLDGEYEMLVSREVDAKVKLAREKIQAAENNLAAVQKGEGTYQSLRPSRKALETPADKEDTYSPVYSSTSTGRRTALARWIASTKNPLTARVAVNHVWMRHFGEPLVESVFDFGLRAKKPAHAELLDRLAAEFMQSGWSFRHLHRLLVTSAAYRRSSSQSNADAATLAADPNNEFYWRMNSRRMESQIVRDSLLQLSGTLDMTIGGPSVEVNGKSRRRSLYFRHSPDDQDLFLAMFDDADLLQCYRRSESIVPQQALALANSSLTLTLADDIRQQVEQRIVKSGETETSRRDFISHAFLSILGRQPNNDEMTECSNFCDQLQQLSNAETVRDVENPRELRIRTRLIHALLNHNDFITIR